MYNYIIHIFVNTHSHAFKHSRPEAILLLYLSQYIHHHNSIRHSSRNFFHSHSFIHLYFFRISKFSLFLSYLNSNWIGVDIECYTVNSPSWGEREIPKNNNQCIQYVFNQSIQTLVLFQKNMQYARKKYFNIIMKIINNTLYFVNIYIIKMYYRHSNNFHTINIYICTQWTQIIYYLPSIHKIR